MNKGGKMPITHINVCWDSELSNYEVHVILDACIQVRELFPELTFDVYGSDPWSEGEYSSADWYVDQAKEYVTRWITASGEIIDHLQLDADSIVDRLGEEPWQRSDPHIDIMMVSKELMAFDHGHPLNIVFVLADGRVTVQSVARYRGLPPRDRYLAIQAVIWHELGHILGMAGDLRRSHTEYNLGPHCTNYCVMRQGLSVEEWVQHARQATGRNRIYCPQCLADARRYFTS